MICAPAKKRIWSVYKFIGRGNNHKKNKSCLTEHDDRVTLVDENVPREVAFLFGTLALWYFGTLALHFQIKWLSIMALKL